MDGVRRVGDWELVFASSLNHMHHDVPRGEGGGPDTEIRFSFIRSLWPFCFGKRCFRSEGKSCFSKQFYPGFDFTLLFVCFLV